MKKRLLFIIVCIGISITGCSSVYYSEEESIESEVVVDESSPEQDAEDNVVELFQAVYDEVQEGNGNLSYKEIENIYKVYPDNEVISNLYYYCVANEYLHLNTLMETGDYQELAEETAAKIDSNYTGSFSNEIITFAENLLGDTYAEKQKEVLAFQDKYDSLTTQDKAGIISYIYGRYDYYDQKDGKNTGDKYSDTIWDETMEKYGITKLQVDNIWNDTDATNYYNSNSSSDDSISSVSVYDATLEYGSTDVMIAIDEDAMDKFFDAITNEDEGSLDSLIANGQIAYTAKGTKCNIIKNEITKYQVELLDGDYAGNTVWVILESVHRTDN